MILNNDNIKQVRLDNSEVYLIRIDGIDIYTKHIEGYYRPKEFKGNSTITDVEIMVHKMHTNLSEMFYDCTALTTVNTNDWITSNVTNMSYMFRNCSALVTLDISNWDTSNVTNINYMFRNCNSLTELNLSSWDISQIDINDYQNFLGNIFYDCISLHTLYLNDCNRSTIRKMITPSGFPINAIDGVIRKIYCNPDNVAGLTVPENWVFIDYKTGEIFEPIPLPIEYYKPYEFKDNIDIIEVKTIVADTNDDLSAMFYCCYKLETVDTTNWDTSNVITMNNMFYFCESLTSLNLSNFNTSKVSNMGGMFRYCSKLTSLDLSNFDTSKVTNMSQMFGSCSNLTSLDLNNFDTSKVTLIDHMFNGCSSLIAIEGINKFKTNKVTDMRWMFRNCSSLTELDLSNWDVSNVTYMQQMFKDCTNLVKLNLRNWQISGGYFDRIFEGCESLAEVDLSNCDYYTLCFISANLPTGKINGETRKIYCKETSMNNPDPDTGPWAEMPKPDGWEFVYVD